MSYDTKPDDSQNPAMGRQHLRERERVITHAETQKKRDVITTFVAPQSAKKKIDHVSTTKIGIGSWHWSI